MASPFWLYQDADFALVSDEVTDAGRYLQQVRQTLVNGLTSLDTDVTTLLANWLGVSADSFGAAGPKPSRAPIPSSKRWPTWPNCSVSRARHSMTWTMHARWPSLLAFRIPRSAGTLMVENAQPFRVDLDELEQIVARVLRFVGFLNDSLDGLQQRVSAVQSRNWNSAPRSGRGVP